MTGRTNAVSGGGKGIETVIGSFTGSSGLASFLIAYSDGESGHGLYITSPNSFQLNIMKNSIIAIAANTFNYTGGLEKVPVQGLFNPAFDTYFVSDDFNVTDYS